MVKKISSFEEYLVKGCGRCSYSNTPDCKVNNWIEELKLLRELILSFDIKETIKWGVPCYTYHNKNEFLLSAFKEYCAISFFKGTLLNDPERLLVSPSENSQHVKMIKIKNVNEIKRHKSAIKNLIKEAIEIENKGLKVEKKGKIEYPDELNELLKKDFKFKQAFESLTPGRQRGYIIYFSSAKNPETRKKRLEKYLSKILDGKGIYD